MGNINKTVNTLLILGIGTLLLSIIGLYNGYPLVYSDTGTYLYSGFDRFVPFDRPVAYGLFLRIFSFNYSAWFVIIFQNLLTAFILYKTFTIFFKNKERFKQIYYLTILFLVIFTGIGWYSNQLMPDFFAPISILSIFILIKDDKLSLCSIIIMVIIFTYSLITHFSHLLLATIIVVVLLFCKWIFTQKLNDLSLKRILLVSITVFCSWIIVPTINYTIEKQFVLSKGSHVFLMAHLADTGVLEKFLKENCENPDFKDCKLCNYKESLPSDLATFIWDGNILKNTGGWEDSKEEYDKIIHATLKRPKYLFMNIYRSLSYGLIQLTRNDIGQGLSAYNEGSAPYGQIHWRFNSELNNYLNSKQNKWNGVNLSFDTLNIFHLALILISFFAVVLLLTSQVLSRLHSNSVFFLLFVLGSIVLNSFITAGLNSPCQRFQARVVWLIPLSLIILIVKNFDIIKKAFQGNMKK